jgi:hypothetical protein
MVKWGHEAKIAFESPILNGERPGASVLGLAREARVYNPTFLPNQLRRMGLPDEVAQPLGREYWEALHAIDERFSKTGMRVGSRRSYIPAAELAPKLSLIRTQIERLVGSVRNAFDERLST